jgi:hypothetical protein
VRERRNEPERERKEEGGHRGFLGHLQQVEGEAGGGSGGLQSEQEVAQGTTWELHAATPWDSTKKTKKTLQIAP